MGLFSMENFDVVFVERKSGPFPPKRAYRKFLEVYSVNLYLLYQIQHRCTSHPGGYLLIKIFDFKIVGF
jgi:hypothetical protein